MPFPQPEIQPPETTAAPETSVFVETIPAPETTEAPAEGGCSAGIVAIVPVVAAVVGAVALRKKRRD